VKLRARNQLLRYQDASGIFHFSVARSGKQWLVHLPPSFGRGSEPHPLSPGEADRVLPRIERFLSRIWWFGVWPVRYSVSFVGGAK
jgi:hypothetical protein